MIKIHYFYKIVAIPILLINIEFYSGQGKN